MLSFIKKHNTIKPEQFGFREKHSHIPAVLRASEFMRKTKEQKSMGLALFIDLRKAFGTVCHSFKKKLSTCGFREKFTLLISNYLSNRQQYLEN